MSSLPTMSSKPLAAERGSAFLLALIIIVLLTILGVSIVLVTETEMALGHTEKTIDRQTYAAETGLWAAITGLVLTNRWNHERVAIPIQPDTGQAIPGRQLAYAVNTSKSVTLANGCPAWTDCGEDLGDAQQFQSHFGLLASTAQRVAIDSTTVYDPDNPATFETPFEQSASASDHAEDIRFNYVKGTGGVDRVQVLGQATVAIGFMVSPLRGVSADTISQRRATDATTTGVNSGFRSAAAPVPTP